MTWSTTSIPPEDVTQMWPIVAPLLAPAIARGGGRLTMRDAFRMCGESRYLLWVTYDADRVVQAAFLTRVAEYPRKRMLVVDAAGGRRMREWVADVQATFVRFAADSGCAGVEMYGRRGWVRMLQRYGWRQQMVVLEINAGAQESGA